MSGDWLSKLALTYLGDANRWPEIYDANRSVIESAAAEHVGPPVFGTSDHGHWIFPGTQLRIPTAQSGCAPVTTGQAKADCSHHTFLIAVRGSGENPPNDPTAPLGREIADVATRMTKADPDTTVFGVPYPAAGFPSDLKTNDAFWKSVEEGRRLVREAIERQAVCHGQKIVLAGYSQGALAIRKALADLSPSLRSRVSGIALLGDPTFPPGVPSDLKKQTSYYCLPKDPVCSGDLSKARECQQLKDTCPHFKYIEEGKTEEAAKFLESRPLREINPFPTA